MINKQIDDITKDNIQYLIENKVAEMKTLEFKQKLPGKSYKDKKEFMADVASFANASGGDIIFGIKGEVKDNQKTGAPESIILSPFKVAKQFKAENIIEILLRRSNQIGSQEIIYQYYDM